jgi:phage baseplate assembly protein W
MNGGIEFIDPSGNSYGYTMEDFINIDWGAAGVFEILQNVYRLILTSKYSVRLDRLMGFEADYVDSPINLEPDIFTAEVLDVVHRYEPRVEILDIDFRPDLDGKMVTKIKLVLRNVIFGTRTPYLEEIRYPQ